MKRFLAAMTAALLMVVLASSAALAARPTPPTDLMGQAWRVQYIMPATSALWDINRVKRDADGNLTFPIREFQSTTTGSFAVYFNNNYNTDITGKTLSAEMYWTIAASVAGGQYVTRGPATDGAYVRFEFQDVASGPYTSNDYWWSSVRSDLNVGWGDSMTASLADRTLWTNICGQSATDTTPHPGPNCVGGTDPAVSPYDGFTNAMKNVKQVGLSFGRASSYASGVALVGGTGTFAVAAFTVTP